MQDKGAPPQYDSNYYNTAGARSVILGLVHEQPGKVDRYGKRFADIAIDRTTTAASIPPKMSYEELVALLYTRIEKHFHIDTSSAKSLQSRIVCCIGMHIAPEGTSIEIADDIAWEASKVWLVDGAKMNLNFALLEDESTSQTEAAGGTKPVPNTCILQ